jgi:hypothetical protein
VDDQDENAPPDGELDPRRVIPPGRRKRQAAVLFKDRSKAEFKVMMDSIKGTEEEREEAREEKERLKLEKEEDRRLERDDRAARARREEQMERMLLAMLHQMKDGAYSGGTGV